MADREHGSTMLMQPTCLQQAFSEIILERDGEMEETEVSLLLSSPPWRNTRQPACINFVHCSFISWTWTLEEDLINEVGFINIEQE